MDPFEKVCGTLAFPAEADTTLILARGAHGGDALRAAVATSRRSRPRWSSRPGLPLAAPGRCGRDPAQAMSVEAILDALKAAGRPIGPKEIADVTEFKNGEHPEVAGEDVARPARSRWRVWPLHLVTPVTPVTVSENETPDPPFMH